MNIENVTVSITDVMDSLSSNKANFDKPDYVWRNELLSLGLVEKDKMFTIPGQTAPLAIVLASKGYQSRCGSTPRISLFNRALNDAVLISVLEKYDLEITKNMGTTIKGYDFPDVKASDVLTNVLAVIVQEYEKLKASSIKPQFVTASEESIFRELG
ncbi:hypothetical protein Q8W17_01505 [Photobacterium damselae subsp. piscicida]|nr:hypothetical protein [Photobacterium damselae subsp. piscicida]